MTECRCGCGASVKPPRVFVNKEHQIDWMFAGGAREMGALEPLEGRQRGGSIVGRRLAESGQLQEAGRKGAQRSREIGERVRARRRQSKSN